MVAGAVLVAAGLLLWRDVPLNQALFLAVNRLGPEAPTLWSCLSVAGLGLAAWIYLTAFAEDRPERVARLLWILVVGGIVIHVVKHQFAAPRPLAVLGESGMTVIGEALRTHSMPSGHSAMAFAMLALVLANTRMPGGHDTGRTRLLVAVATGWTALALGIALSRLAVGAHWPADALFGAGLGLLFAGFAPRAWPVAALTRLLARPLGQRLMAAGLVACAAAIAATPTVFAALGRGGSKLEHQFSTGYPLAEPFQWALALVALAGALRWWRAAGAKAPH
jgi:membrane-associated phospholipid phosphatase